MLFDKWQVALIGKGLPWVLLSPIVMAFPEIRVHFGLGRPRWIFLKKSLRRRAFGFTNRGAAYPGACGIGAPSPWPLRWLGMEAGVTAC